MPSRRKIDVPPGTIDSFPEGSIERAKLRCKLLQNGWEMGMELSYTQVTGLCGDAFLNEKPWTIFNPENYFDKTMWLEDILGTDFETFERWLRGYDPALADRWHTAFLEEFQGPMPKRGAPVGNDNARKEPEQENKSDSVTFVSSGRGNDADYTCRRLLRDRPDLFELVKAGELSPNAAAIEAGFRKKQISVPVDDADAVVRRLIKNDYTFQEIEKAWKAHDAQTSS